MSNLNEPRTFDLAGYVRVYEFTPGNFSLGVCVYDTYAEALEDIRPERVAIVPVQVQGKVGDGLPGSGQNTLSGSREAGR